MKYYSTNRQAPEVSLSEAVIKGLAPDKGLYMPERINPLPQSFFDHIQDMSLQEVAYAVADTFFGEDIPADDLKHIVYDTLQFDIPLVKVNERIYSLELYHGPTCAFKDVGARFMARLLSYFVKQHPSTKGNVHVLVATSGDTGSAVANGFLGVPGIDVTVLYPKGKVSEIQEKQFTTLGQNITALEVDGVFDDCQRMVKEAFMDKDINAQKILTSANSINLARFLPQSVYYVHALAQIPKEQWKNLVICVPSGNFGDITAGLVAYKMGMPVKRFIAAVNANKVFPDFLQTGEYKPQPSLHTLANAMDVGDPSNFARVYELFGRNVDELRKVVSSYSYSDEIIGKTIAEVSAEHGYTCDPHGAVGYAALKDNLQTGEKGLFLETAHPAKFIDTVERFVGKKIEIPERLAKFLNGKKQSVVIEKDYHNILGSLK